MKINTDTGYVEITHGREGKKQRKNKDWFLVKYKTKDCGYINLKHLHFPAELVGRRIKIKIENLEEIKLLKKFEEFINNYNRIGYGTAKTISTPKNIVIECYNAGFSENEELETEFIQDHIIRSFMTVNNHPIKIFRIPKLIITDRFYNSKDIQKFLHQNKHETRPTYKYNLEIE